MSFKLHTGAVVICSLAGCQAGSRVTPGRFTEMEPLGEYTAGMRRLFDDELGVLAMSSVPEVSATDPTSILYRRVLAANDIVICHVGTVTEGSAGESTYASIEFRGTGQSLARAAPIDCPPISVSAKSDSFLIIHQSNAAFVGKSIVIFIQQFNELGRPTLHWHAELDGPLIRDEVKRFGTSLQ